VLDLPRYLLGVFEIALLVGFAWLGASALRSRLLPDFSGAPAHLATVVLGLALLIWVAEVLGTLALFEPLPYLLAVGVAGLGLRAGIGEGWGCPGGRGVLFFAAPPQRETQAARQKTQRAPGHPHPSPEATERAGKGGYVATVVGLAIAAVAAVKFGLDVKPKLSSGMTGFDSTWYHGPFAAGFFQTGDTWGLHYIAPQFLAWFYPANSELLHAVGMLVFDRDVLSPLLNLGWFVGCLVVCWCIGRPFGVAPWSLALGAIALSVPAFADQAGEARNDIVGTFFLLAAVAITLNARQSESLGGKRSVRVYERKASTNANSAIVAGLAAGLAAGTKLNFLLPAAVLVVGLAVVAPREERWRSLAAGALGALAGSGYWYLRNLVHTGNPLPWIDAIGPISLPAPDQALGGREGHSVLGYLFDGSVWSDWFLPGLHDGLWIVWPLLLGLAVAGLVLCLVPTLTRKSAEVPSSDGVLLVAGLTGLATALAWLIAPTSASGPEGMPRGFESGLRYLAPALILGLALLPAAQPIRLGGAGVGHPSNGRILKVSRLLARHLSGRGMPHAGPAVLGLVAVVLAVAVGYPVQRHYLENRYANPSFTTPGLNAAFEWVRSVSDAHIATTSTRQYPLFGTDLSNEVEFIGEEQPHGGFTAPTTCQQWRRLLNEGEYDYVVTSHDRIEPGKPTYPPTATWTKGAGATAILREPPTIVYRLTPLDPSPCSS
jgi:hypothetical protein